MSVNRVVKELTTWLSAVTADADKTLPAIVPPSDEPSQSLVNNRYELIGPIGQGGMGTVYKAKQILTGRIVALKMLPSNVTSPERVLRFRQEAQAACAFNHPNAVSIYDFDITKDNKPYLVMQLLEGKTLADWLETRGPLQESEVLAIFSQIADALIAAHQQKIVHRDVKPSNIMLSVTTMGDLHAVLFDFGIAKMIDDQEKLKLTKSGEIFGSPLYMSPEQFRGVDIGPQADVYSFGCVMYEALTGAPPFHASNFSQIMYQHLQEEPAPLAKANLRVPVSKAMELLIKKALQKNPANRYQSMIDLRQDLTAIKAAAKAPVEKSRSFSKFGLAGLLVGLTAAVAVGIYAHNLWETQHPLHSDNLEKLHEALLTAKSTDQGQHKEEVSHRYDEYTCALMDCGKLTTAMDTANEWISYVSHTTGGELSTAYRVRAEIYQHAERYEEALKDLNTAIQIAKEQKSPIHIVNALEDMSSVFRTLDAIYPDRGYSDKAINALKDAIDLATRPKFPGDNKGMLLRSRYFLGVLYNREQKYDEAAKCFNLAAPTARSQHWYEQQFFQDQETNERHEQIVRR